MPTVRWWKREMGGGTSQSRRTSAALLRQIIAEQRVNPTVLNYEELARFSAVIELDSNRIWTPTDAQRIACEVVLQALQTPNILYSNREVTPADVWAIIQLLPPELAVKFRVNRKLPTTIGFRS